MFDIVDQETLPHDQIGRTFEGERYGSTAISCLLIDAPPGAGPGLHTHPYEEILVVQEGRTTVTVFETEIEAVAGQIVVVPAGTPHKFVNSGQGRLRQVDIHASARIVTKWLEG